MSEEGIETAHRTRISVVMTLAALFCNLCSLSVTVHQNIYVLNFNTSGWLVSANKPKNGVRHGPLRCVTSEKKFTKAS